MDNATVFWLAFVVWVGCLYRICKLIRDAESRGQNGLLVIAVCLLSQIAVANAIAYVIQACLPREDYIAALVFIILSGPAACFVALVIWRAVRPQRLLVEKTIEDYRDADSALNAASRLEMIGEWSAAQRLFHEAAERWPEHESYAEQCVFEIQEKKLRVAAGEGRRRYFH